MDQKQLINLANNYKDQKEFITNEETAKMSLVVPFIRLLGYDPNLPREVRLEYKAEFTQGDGKRLRDSMDFALFDKSGFKPLMIIETKPLGTNLKSNSPQLARYIAQLPDLHFGILTDGCNYLFYGDLESPNIMDSDPFFTFSLDDSKIDWTTVASFLTKFSRDAFNAETLLTDAENSRYRQAMVDKLVSVLRAPAEDEEFMKWLTAGIYTGLRTAKVMTRMAEIARGAIEPALLHVMGDEFIDQLKNRIHAAQKAKADIIEPAKEAKEIDDNNADDADDVKIKKSSIITTEDELQSFEIIKGIIEDSDYDVEKILYKDTVNYFNVSYDKPTRWFIRVFADSKRKNIVTLVELEKAQELGEGFDVEKAPKVFGVSRIFIEDIEDITKLNNLVLESLKTLCGN